MFQFILKLIWEDSPPPGIGLFTCSVAVLGAARSAAGMATCNCPEFTKTVVRGDPFHSAIDPRTKFEPVMVIQVLPAGEAALAGEVEETVGTGFGVDERGRTEGPFNRTTRPVPSPQTSFAVRNARPSSPHRMRSKAPPARPPNSMVPTGVRCAVSKTEIGCEVTP